MHIDRAACAWLIRRYIDPDPHLRLRRRPQRGSVRCDTVRHPRRGTLPPR
ncbi:chromate resistance protein ChrB domain-containing protein [Actinopolymorpha singaporensis]|nr:chromate resistance protein ChrB domain-containing protein [Actinopolymorpha singaporensis]